MRINYSISENLGANSQMGAAEPTIIQDDLTQTGDLQLNQEGLSTITLVSEPPNTMPPTPAFSSEGIIILIPLSFLAIWAITVSLVANLFEIEKDDLIIVEDVLELSPCRNCRFFTDNPYLRCAVHPDTVLTPGAMSCSDYDPKLVGPPVV